ncbi:MAG: hypothetical protein JST04_16145 [Bdellovibrionales bacterium]|nr:hypothetical protein [Bdellovibrionales bacterium]
MRNRVLGFLVFAIFALGAAPGCQMKRSITCSVSSGDRAACEAKSDDCMVIQESKCQGSDPICYNWCHPDDERKICAEFPDSGANCPRDGRLFSAGTVREIEKYKWAYDHLSPFGRTLSGKTLTKNDYDQLTNEDKGQLCGSVKDDPCHMQWSTGKNVAECVFGPLHCEACAYIGKPIRCQAKNKCSGVICL